MNDNLALAFVALALISHYLIIHFHSPVLVPPPFPDHAHSPSSPISPSLPRPCALNLPGLHSPVPPFSHSSFSPISPSPMHFTAPISRALTLPFRTHSPTHLPPPIFLLPHSTAPPLSRPPLPCFFHSSISAVPFSHSPTPQLSISFHTTIALYSSLPLSILSVPRSLTLSLPHSPTTPLSHSSILPLPLSHYLAPHSTIPPISNSIRNLKHEPHEHCPR